MSRRTTPSSDEFRDDLDFDQLTWDNELGRELARVRRRCEGGQQRHLSECLEGHTTPWSAGVGQSPLVTPHAVQHALQQAMEMSGVPTASSTRVGVAPNGASSLSSGGPSVTAVRTAAQDLPSPPTFSPRQIEVMERITQGNFLAGQIDGLLESVGLDNNQLTDYIVNRPPTPQTTSPPPAPRGRGRGRSGTPPGGDGDDDGSPPGGCGSGGGERRGRGPPARRARMNQDELRRQMDLLAEDARQRSVGRRIAGITHTNTVTTVYKDGGEPEVYRTSSRLSTPNTV